MGFLGMDPVSQRFEMNEKNPSQISAEFALVEKVKFLESGEKGFRLIYRLNIFTLTASKEN